MAGTQQTHVSAVLSGMAVEFRSPAHVAQEVVKPARVLKENDLYLVFDKGMWDATDDIRADGTPSKEIERGWRYDSYVIEGHALKQKITKRARENADPGLELDRRAAELVKQQVLNGLEQRIFGASGFLRTPGNNIGNVNVDWTNLSTANVRGAVNTALEAVENGAGVTPNTIVMTTVVARHIMQTAQYLEETKYVTDRSQQAGANDLPATFFGMRAVYVGALINTARKGQAPAPTRLMGDDIWIGYVDPNPLQQGVLTHSALIHTDEYVRSWYDDEIEADWVEYNFNYTPKIIARECGYLLQSVLTS